MHVSAAPKLSTTAKLVTAALLVLGAAMWTGCGEDEGSGDSSFDSSVSGDREMRDLSEDDRETLCLEAREFLNREISVREFCTAFTHVAIAEGRTPDSEELLQQRCDQFRQACVDQYEGNELFDEGGCDGLEDSNCGAEVSLVESCIEDSGNEFDDFASSQPDCDEVTVSYYEDFSTEQIEERPASCQSLSEQCPAFDDLGEFYSP